MVEQVLLNVVSDFDPVARHLVVGSLVLEFEALLLVLVQCVAAGHV